MVCVTLAGCATPPPTTDPTSAPVQTTTSPARATVTAVTLPKGTFPRFPYVATDGTVWVSESSGEALGHIDQSGAVSHVRIPGNNNSPADIVRGPDDAIWFGGFQLIGKVTGSTVSGWRTGKTDLGLPATITAGPDQAIWFTNKKVPPAISRITASGAVTHHTLQIADPVVDLPGITTGPDGALWFTVTSMSETAPHSIGRMATDGGYQLLPLPDRPNPRRIVAGRDGALWFTTDRAIGRMTIDGKYTEHALPDGVRPFDITAAPDGTLWFSTNQPQVGRITTPGEVSFHPIDGAKQLIGIAVGPDGTVWVGGGSDDVVWKLTGTK